MNLFFRELKAYRNMTVIWIMALSVLACVFLLMYPAFANDVVVSKSIISNLPPAIRNAFELSTNGFFTIYGFFAYLTTFLVLAGAVQSMNLGVNVLSKEDSGKTADFLLTKPVSRRRVFICKVLAVFSLIIVTNIIFCAVSLVTAKLVSVDSFSSHTFLLISGILFLVQMFFMALGLLLSLIIPKIKSSIVVALPTVFAFFIVGMLGSILGDDNIKYLSPFKFFDHNYIINNNNYELKFLIIDAVFVAIVIIVSYVIYIKKDIKAGS